MQNKQLADTILDQEAGGTLVIADSAEPKSIDDIKLHGVNIVGSEKGKDSVRNGISLVQEQRISITKRSINIIREYRNYLWKVDKDGNLISPNVPEHEFSHSMDAIRYGLSGILKQPTFKTPQQSLPAEVAYPELGI